MLSQISRRALMASRTPARRLVCTQTYAQVRALEKVFDSLHWHDARDKVEEIRLLMDEHKTNNTVKTPPLHFENMVTEKLHEIQAMAEQAGSNHEDIFHRVWDVKADVKNELYA